MCATLFDSGDGTGAGRMEIRNGSYKYLGVYNIDNLVSSLNMDAGCVLFSYLATDFQNGVTQTFKGYAQSSNLYLASDLVNGLNDEMSSLECFCNLISIDGESFHLLLQIVSDETTLITCQLLNNIRLLENYSYLFQIPSLNILDVIH